MLIVCFVLAMPLAINTVSSNVLFIEQHLAVLHVCGFAIQDLKYQYNKRGF